MNRKEERIYTMRDTWMYLLSFLHSTIFILLTTETVCSSDVSKVNFENIKEQNTNCCRLVHRTEQCLGEHTVYKTRFKIVGEL